MSRTGQVSLTVAIVLVLAPLGAWGWNPADAPDMISQIESGTPELKAQLAETHVADEQKALLGGEGNITKPDVAMASMKSRLRGAARMSKVQLESGRLVPEPDVPRALIEKMHVVDEQKAALAGEGQNVPKSDMPAPMNDETKVHNGREAPLELEGHTPEPDVTEAMMKVADERKAPLAGEGDVPERHVPEAVRKGNITELQAKEKLATVGEHLIEAQRTKSEIEALQSQAPSSAWPNPSPVTPRHRRQAAQDLALVQTSAHLSTNRIDMKDSRTHGQDEKGNASRTGECCRAISFDFGFASRLGFKLTPAIYESLAMDAAFKVTQSQKDLDGKIVPKGVYMRSMNDQDAGFVEKRSWIYYKYQRAELTTWLEIDKPGDCTDEKCNVVFGSIQYPNTCRGRGHPHSYNYDLFKCGMYALRPSAEKETWRFKSGNEWVSVTLNFPWYDCNPWW